MKKHLTILFASVGALLLMVVVTNHSHVEKKNVDPHDFVIKKYHSDLVSPFIVPDTYVFGEAPVLYRRDLEAKEVKQYDLVSNPIHSKHLHRFVRLC